MKKIVSLISTFFYELKQGFVGIFRNGVMSLSSMLALVCCMVVLGTFYILIDLIEVNFMAIDDMNVIEVYIGDKLDDDALVRIDSELKKIKNDQSLGIVESYEFMSKSDNWHRFLEMYESNASDDESGDGNILTKYFDENNNPLPASYRIHFTSFSDKDKLYELKYRISNIDGIDQSDIKENFTLYEKVTNVKNAITVTGVWLLVILFIVTLLFIINTIKLGIKARSNEIKFMKFCGATNKFIVTPFVIEGVLIGLFSAGVALGLQYYVYNFVLADIFKEYGIGTTGAFAEYMPVLLFAFILIGLLAGTLGSGMCIKKYLKV